MVEFERGLRQVNGRNYGYVRPLSAVSEGDWIQFFGPELAGRQLENFFLLVDLAGFGEPVGVKGVTWLVETIHKRRFKRTRIAVVAVEEQYSAAAKLLKIFAKSRQLDFKFEFFDDLDSAEAWIGDQ